MSNLTKEMKEIYGLDDLDNIDLEKRKRFKVMLKDAYDIDIASLVRGNLGPYSLPFQNFKKTTINNTDNHTENIKHDDSDAITPKQLIDLAFSAFGMKLHRSASNFLKEAFLRLGRFFLLFQCNS